MDPLVYLQRLVDGDVATRKQDLDALTALIQSGEFRDTAFTAQLYSSLFSLVAVSSCWSGPSSPALRERAQTIFLQAVRFPEFDVALAGSQLNGEFLASVFERVGSMASQEEWPFIQNVVVWVYQNFVEQRGQIRRNIGASLRSFQTVIHRNVPVGPLLLALVPIIRGFSNTPSKIQRGLLDLLLPLHRPNEWLQWDRQSSLISMYHKELTQCILLLVEKQPSLSVRCIETIFSHLPCAREANTQKELLLLIEIGQILRFLDAAGFKHLLPTLTRHMLRLLGSQNAQPIQQVLKFWKDPHFVELSKLEAATLISELLPALLRGGELFWNTTVNRMTSLVLEKLEASDPDVFAQTVESIWGGADSLPFERADLPPPPEPVVEGPKSRDGRPDVSMKALMGGWQPPVGSRSGTCARPPLSVTGVAPWATGAAGNRPQNPPSTVTGIAPWAFEKKRLGGPLSAVAGAHAKLGTATGSQSAPGPPKRTGLERLRAYKELLCPAASPESARSWEVALNAETPTLLATLKFHQLVFNQQDLGTGAFGVVRYARQVVRGSTQSQWPEYAVKVINTKTIEELNYEACVNREICILRMLSHPGVARMVASFRYRDGAYLVLEYAAKGDLHSVLRRQGPLPEETTRFFTGELVAALCAIHEIGFVYGDLKPENVVITSRNHAKLTDFGGCRPITEEARQRTRQSLLRSLRDGDWRAMDDDREPVDATLDEAPEDDRVEGTTMYLSPEVVSGAVPTLAADAWALGCVLFQLLTGKPPMWVDSEREEDLRARIVTFRCDDGEVEMAPLSPLSRGLVAAFLERDVGKRLSIAAAPTDPFFNGVDVFSLYRQPMGPEVQSGGDQQVPEGDARWQKRQYSKIWTAVPQAEEYESNFQSTPATGPSFIAETAVEQDVPFRDETAVLPLRSSVVREGENNGRLVSL